jgi:hypothetical protein
MRRYATIASIAVSAVLAGSTAAIAFPAQPPACAPTASRAGLVPAPPEPVPSGVAAAPVPLGQVPATGAAPGVAVGPGAEQEAAGESSGRSDQAQGRPAPGGGCLRVEPNGVALRPRTRVDPCRPR